MDIKRLLGDYNVPFVTEGNKHCTRGWVNIHCPFCAGSKNFHLGLQEEGKAAHCWRCGQHPVVKTLSSILNLPQSRTRAIMQKYGTIRRKRIAEPTVAINPLKYPKPNNKLTKPYKDYLSARGFDPDKLEQEWQLQQTGPVSYLDDIDYSYRIIIPVIWDGEIVTFQARDITDKNDFKYLACPKHREKIHHKTILYGRQDLWQNCDGIIIVEGVTDVWRLGTSAVATFGTQFKMEQVLQLAKHNNNFFIIFDDDIQAQKQARALATKLKALGKTAQIEKIKEDPGGMEQEDADYLVRYLLSREVKK